MDGLELTWVHADADTIVWLDLPRSLVMRRVTRTIRRTVARRALERQPRAAHELLPVGPEKNIVRWSWTMHDSYRQRYLTAIADGTWDHATVHQLTSVESVSKFLAEAT